MVVDRRDGVGLRMLVMEALNHTPGAFDAGKTLLDQQIGRRQSWAGLAHRQTTTCHQMSAIEVLDETLVVTRSSCLGRDFTFLLKLHFDLSSRLVEDSI